MKKASAFLLTCFLSVLLSARADLSDLYDTATLKQWWDRNSSFVQKIFDRLVYPALLDEEKQRLGSARPEHPLLPDERYRAIPIAFYNPVGTSAVVMPVSSLKFLDDLCVADAWLHVNGYTEETVFDYSGMLVYRDFTGRALPRPLPTLGIPADALADSRVKDLADANFISAYTFILLHELGHVYYRHAADNYQQSQANERQADSFALKVILRTKLPPLGMLIFFLADASWTSYPTKATTHPLTSDRLIALADGLARAYPSIAQGIRSIGESLADPDVAAANALVRKTVNESQLGPRRPGQKPLPEETKSPPAEFIPFNGIYRGTYTQLIDPGYPGDIRVKLNRRGTAVIGVYNFGSGLGRIVDGKVTDDTLVFRWIWGPRQGRGRFHASEDGGNFTGTWGWDDSFDNAGTWNGELER